MKKKELTIHERWAIDSEMITISGKEQKSSDLSQQDINNFIENVMIFKGGVGSGIRGHRTVREVAAKLSPKVKQDALEKLKAEQAKRERGDTQKPSTTTNESVFGNNKRRGHLPPFKQARALDEASKDLMTNSKGLDIKTAKQLVNTVTEYSDGYFKDIRSGVDKERAQMVEDFIRNSPKWDNNSPLYRGVSLPSNIAIKMKVGQMVDMKGVSSWSSNKGVADKFTEEGYSIGNKPERSENIGVLFFLPKTNSGASVSHFSEMPYENEVILSAMASLRVKSIKSVDGIQHIELEEYTIRKMISLLIIKATKPEKKGKAILIQEKWKIDSSMVEIVSAKKSPNISQQDINNFIENVLKHIKIKMRE